MVVADRYTGMRGIRCPNCRGNAGNEVDGELLGPEVKRTFECESCGHSWNVVI